MRAGDNLDADDLPDLGSGSSAGISRGLDCGDIASEKSGDVTAADFFPADQCYVCRFQGGVAGLKQSTQALALNHSNRLLNHKNVWLRVITSYLGLLLTSPKNDFNRSS
jgi:hypothetical protein